MKNMPTSLLVVPLGKTLNAGFSHLGVEGRWPVTPK